MKFDTENLGTLIIKIGTSLLSGQRAFEGQVMEAVVKELCQLKLDYDINVLIVTSGAVGCGMKALGMTQRPNMLSLKQAVASVGQATLMHYYETLFLTYGDQKFHTAQVLLTLADLDKRRVYLNVRNTLQTLFSMKTIIPIINENDSTAVEELRFGDNDTLAAKIAAKLNAGLLIILSDVNGLYDRNPSQPGAALIEEVAAITPEIEACAGGAGSVASTGGMRTKLDAAKIACAAGVPVVIANGHEKNVIQGVLAGTLPCTLFAAAEDALSHRKRWIAFGRATHGALIIDAGAARAIREKGTSLLAAGILEVRGNFDTGDAVRIQDGEGRDVARALVNYTSAEIRQIQGRKSHEIAHILGHKAMDEVVHRDNLVVI